MPYAHADIVVDHAVRVLCTKPYPGHRWGCPNFGLKNGCPPQAQYVGQVLDLDQVTYAIWNVFDLGHHVDRMADAHPEWSDRQLMNCLYWQGGARKDLRNEIRRFFDEVEPPEGHRWTILGCPEGAGVNVTATMAGIGIVLEWPPRDVAYQVVVAGVGMTAEEMGGGR